MRKKTLILRVIAMIFLFAASGCNENYTVVTSLLPDGSCDRIITVTSDSGKIPDVAFPLPVDSTWQISWNAPAQKGEKYVFTARKHFASVEELSREYALQRDSNKIKVAIVAAKSFRWFYTYFTYRETYGQFNPFRLVPLSQFMTQDEVQRYHAGEKSDSLKKKRDAWEQRNMFEEFYRGLIEAARGLDDPTLPVSLIESKKEELFLGLMGSKSDDETNEVATVLGTPAVRKLSKDLKVLVEEIVHKTEIASKAGGDYVNTVVMPGTILDTNAEEVKGNSVVWRFTDEHLNMADYVMQVESRSINVWALIVTGLVVLLLVALPFWMRSRQERRLSNAV